MKDKLTQEDILSRSSLKENPFGVPKGYFDTMKQEIMETISAQGAAQHEEEMEVAPVTFMAYLKPALSLAAVFAIVFGMGWGVMKVTEAYAPQTEFAKIDETPLTEEEEIISILNITMEDIMTTNTATEETPETTLDEEAIEQYLIDSGYPSTAIALVE